jgi:hypothetical protein
MKMATPRMPFWREKRRTIAVDDRVAEDREARGEPVAVSSVEDGDELGDARDGHRLPGGATTTLVAGTIGTSSGARRRPRGRTRVDVASVGELQHALVLGGGSRRRRRREERGALQVVLRRPPGRRGRGARSDRRPRRARRARGPAAAPATTSGERSSAAALISLTTP